jgi:type IV protein arginine methyltransferase
LRQTLKEYINSEVQVRYNKDTGKEDGLFSDVFGEDRMIMGYNEKYLMKVIVDTIVKPGGSLLNIGYGLGYFDTWAWKLGVNSHHIIECHPDVIKNIDIAPVTIHKDIWQNVIPKMIDSGMTFDCVWFDTYIFSKEDIKDEWFRFSEICQPLVSDGGKISFFTTFPTLDVISTLKNNLKNFKLTETIIPDTYEFLYWENK